MMLVLGMMLQIFSKDYNSHNQTDLFVWITPGVSPGLVNINQHISTITDLINSFPGTLPLTVSKHSQNPLECT